MNTFTIGGYIFNSSFDSGNLGKVLAVKLPDDNKEASADGGCMAEFNLYTCPDCGGTPYENSNRTWFFFSVKGSRPRDVVKFNVMNLNRQAKLYSQGMHPVVKMGLGGKWERIKDKPSYAVEDDNFVVSFLHRGTEDVDQEFFYAFTYPYTYTELQNYLTRLDRRFRKRQFELKVKQMEGTAGSSSSSKTDDVNVDKRMKELEESCITSDVVDLNQLNEEDFKSEIYFYRELLTYSVEKRRVDLITISSYHGICDDREQRLENLFPEKIRHRCHTFRNKKIIFVSSRVHPGETPASFVLNGFLSLLLDRKSSVAASLRRLYVFKIVPFLNPDGVYNGLYRSDTLGHNLNRVYLNPSPETHPSIYAVRKLIRFYHFGCDKAESDEQPEIEPVFGQNLSGEKNSSGSNSEILTTSLEPSSAEASEREADITVVKQTSAESTTIIDDEKKVPDNEEKPLTKVTTRKKPFQLAPITNQNKPTMLAKKIGLGGTGARKDLTSRQVSKDLISTTDTSSEEEKMDSTNIFLYIDLHGHASKKGVFMYGNHMSNSSEAIECMLLPRIMSMNCHHFHFDACNFSERNMYHKGKRDGLSKEGSGRVSVYKMTGLIKSYTLECNYNTGKCVNILPPRSKKESSSKVVNLVPPKYSPAIFEEIGRALGPSILDLTNSNPVSRLANSDYRSLQGLRNAMRLEIEKTFAKSHSTASSGSSGGKASGQRKTKVMKRSGLVNPPVPLEISKENKAYCNLQNWENRSSGVSLVMARTASNRLNLIKGQRKVFVGSGTSSKTTPVASTSNAGCSSGAAFVKKPTSLVKVKDVHTSQIPPKRKKVTGTVKNDKDEPPNHLETVKGLTSASSLPNFFPPPTVNVSDTIFLSPVKLEDDDSLLKPSCSSEKQPPFIDKLKKTHTFTVLPTTSTTAVCSTTKSSTPSGKRLQKSANPLKMKRSLKAEPNIKRKKCRVKTVWH
ncbi:cytosolic carboxypeptidase-like protein 5 [Sergentomyia squamirostris]